MKLIAFALLVNALFVVGHVHFHNHSVLRYEVSSESQKALIQAVGADVWSHDGTIVFGMNDIMVSDDQKSKLAASGMVHQSTMIEDVEAHINAERAHLQSLHSQPLADWFASYHNLSEITAFYENLTATFPATTKYLPSIGVSIQGRPISALTIGSPSAKKKIYFQGGQHAREWISHATVAYITQKLLTDPAAKDLIDNIFFAIVPIVNVDGYAYTWETNRLWRKNRRQNTGGSYGVDLNRNWDDHFGGEGSSTNPASDTYCGTAAFSEPETKAASSFFIDNGPFDGAIDFHRYDSWHKGGG
jgi:hypothetical protein